MASWVRLSALVFVGLVMFVFGFTIHKYEYFPYPQLRKLTRTINGSAATNPAAVLSGQYSADPEKISLGRTVETSLLPLKVSGLRVSDYFPVPKGAGALTSVGDTVIVLDRLGNIYSCSPDGAHVEKLPFPALPNNVTDYLALPHARIDAARFRAYDIEYLPFAKTLAVSHEYFDRQLGKSRLAVSVIPIDDTTIRPNGIWTTIFMGDPEPNGSNESGGGRLVAQAPNRIYLTSGDYAITSPRVSLDPGSSFGKIIEIDINAKSGRIISIGHRNPEGLAIRADGALLSTEHGPKGGDELNLITPGSNYGWPDVSLGTNYGSYDLGDSTSAGEHGGYVSPIFAWLPSIAPTNLIQIEGFNKRWNNDLLVASLKAMSLFRLRMEGTRVLYAEQIWIGQRIRDIVQLKNGTIVLWTDDSQLLFIAVDQGQLDQNVRTAKQVNETLNTACMYCHHFGPTNTSDPAPSLSKLFSRKIGSDNFRYSAGLRSKDGKWTPAELKEFLSDPARFANGTTMPRLDLSPEIIDEIVEILEQSDEPARAGAK